MGDWGWLPTPFLTFARLEQIRELFNGENAFPLVLAHDPSCHPIEQTEIVFLFSLSVTQTLKGAQRAMFIQDDGRGFRRVHRDPCVERLEKRSEGFGTLSQLDSLRLPVHPNNFASHGQGTLEAFQNISDKGQLQLLLFADAVCTHKNRGFIAVFPERRWPFHSGQDTTICGKPVHLEL